jgi:N-acetylglucosamine-6-sulfatase
VQSWDHPSKEQRVSAPARRALAVLTGAATLTLAGCLGGSDDHKDPPSEPTSSNGGLNVVVVLTDDQDPVSTRVMTTLQRQLIAKGTSFQNAYATLPQCCPSRATLLTGQYAHNHGVRGNERELGGYAHLDNSETIATWLDAAGYRTAWVGKFLNGYGEPDESQVPGEAALTDVPEGWDQWWAPVDHTEAMMYGYALNENGSVRRYGTSAHDYQTDVLARKATGFVRDAADAGEPFFLVAAPTAPHKESDVRVGPPVVPPRDPRPASRHLGTFTGEPLPRPPSFADPKLADQPLAQRLVAKYEGRPHGLDVPELETGYRSRLESLLAVDELIGQVIGELRRTGELGRTLVVFTSDQGFVLGEHGLVGKQLPYEESVRVPLVARGPGIERGRRIATPVANVDLAPTIVEAANATAGIEADGVSLLGALRGDAELARRAILLEGFEELPFAGLRTPGGYAYFETGRGEVELYDLDADPYQLHNLAELPRYARLRARLAAQLAELRRCAGETCR